MLPACTKLHPIAGKFSQKIPRIKPSTPAAGAKPQTPGKGGEKGGEKGDMGEDTGGRGLKEGIGKGREGGGHTRGFLSAPLPKGRALRSLQAGYEPAAT